MTIRSSARAYRFLFRDSVGRDVMMNYKAVTDAHALAFAEAKRHGLAVEVWDGERLVAQIPSWPLTAASPRNSRGDDTTLADRHVEQGAKAQQ